MSRFTLWCATDRYESVSMLHHSVVDKMPSVRQELLSTRTTAETPLTARAAILGCMVRVVVCSTSASVCRICAVCCCLCRISHPRDTRQQESSVGYTLVCLCRTSACDLHGTALRFLIDFREDSLT